MMMNPLFFDLALRRQAHAAARHWFDDAKAFNETEEEFSQHYEKSFDSATGIRSEIETRQIGKQWTRKVTETGKNGLLKEAEEFHNMGKADVEEFERRWAQYVAPQPAPQEKTIEKEGAQTLDRPQLEKKVHRKGRKQQHIWALAP